MPANDPPPLAMSYFQLIARRFGDTDARLAAILAGTGVTAAELDEAGAEISLAQQVRQIDNMNALFGDDWTLSAADLWRPTAHGALGVAAMSAPTTGAAIAVVVKYIRVRSRAHRVRLERRADALVIIDGLAVPLSERQWRPIVETDFIAIRAILTALLGSPPDDLRYTFACVEPHHAAKARAVLGGSIAYSARQNAMIIPMSCLDIRSPLADPALHQYALSQLDRALNAASAPEGVRARVERLLARSEAGRLPSTEVAQRLGLSQRTLVRRLAEAGVAYRDLAEAELKARAQRMIASGVLSSAEISDRLGFADPTGFSRARRRWFRKRLVAAPGAN